MEIAVSIFTIFVIGYFIGAGIWIYNKEKYKSYSSYFSSKDFELLKKYAK
jgi:cbb3-type cytochrome oxidase subunit 3